MQKTAEKGRTLDTDNHGAYRQLERKGYRPQALTHSANQNVEGVAHTNGIARVWTVLKRGLEGPFPQVSVKHPERGVAAFTCRLNEGHGPIHTVDRRKA